jgi:hypothetical protein
MTTITADAILWKSRTSFSPESGWRNPREFSKYPVQVGCIAEPYRKRHVAKREIGAGQQCSRGGGSAGAILFPVGIIHGWGIWLGWWQ